MDKVPYPDAASGLSPAQSAPQPTPSAMQAAPGPYPAFVPRPIPLMAPPPRRRWDKWLVLGAVTLVLVIVGGFVAAVGLIAWRVSEVVDRFPGRERNELGEGRSLSIGDAAPLCSIASSDDNDLWAAGREGFGTESGVLVDRNGDCYAVGGWDIRNDGLSALLPSANGESRRVPKDPMQEGAVGLRFLPGSKRLAFACRQTQRVVIAQRREGTKADYDAFSVLIHLSVMEERPLCFDTSPNGRFAAVGCGESWDYSDTGIRTDSVVRDIVLWNLETLARGHTLRGHSNSVRCLDFIDDAKLISGGNDYTLRIWDVGGGTSLRKIETEAPVISVSASPDGKRVAYCTERGHVIVLDLGSGDRKALHRNDDLADSPTDKSRHMRYVRVAWSPDSKWLAVGYSHKLEILEADSLRVRYTQAREIDGGIRDLAWSRDSTRIGAACPRRATVWRLP